MKRLSVLVLLLAGVITSQAQSPVSSPVMHIPLKKVVNLQQEGDTWFPMMKNQHLPKPHPGADRALVASVKAELATRYPLKENQSTSAAKINAAAPLVMRNFQGNAFNFYLPNDNDLAVSNGNVVSSVSNTMIFSKDLNTNSVYGSYTLHSLCASLGLAAEEFDPKITYDPENDRFIVVFLNGFTDSTNNVLVGFSQTNLSYGAYNFYSLPGDALNNGLWTDFPMCAVGEHDFFITGNLLYNDSSWQTGFNQSIIWQIKKDDGYQGNSLTAQVHSNVFYNGSPIRNLCPAKGGSGVYGPDMYFFSNRNFTTGTDSIFLVHLTDTIGSPNFAITVDAVIAPMYYHMPADVPQPNTVDKLIVNDARTMAAFKEGDKFQFVFASRDTATGNTGVYHGRIDISTGTPVMAANLYLPPTGSAAYPNISYAGINPGDEKVVINYLYGASTLYPGSAAIAWDNNGYSTAVTIRPGATFTNMLIGDERWGDYTGSQTKYNQPGYVWVNGSYTSIGNTTRTWIAELNTTTALGVNDNQQLTPATVFPNPAPATATVSFIAPAPGRISIQLFDSKGASVGTIFYGSVVAGENAITFNTGHLSAGIYELIITNAEGREIAREKVVR